jgi:hypothetical protein
MIIIDNGNNNGGDHCDLELAVEVAEEEEEAGGTADIYKI